jgi:hypothetical protein
VHGLASHLTGGPSHLMSNYPGGEYYPGGTGLAKLPPKPPGYDGMVSGMLSAPHTRYMGGYG